MAVAVGARGAAVEVVETVAAGRGEAKEEEAKEGVTLAV